MKFKIVPVTPFAQNCSIIWCPETMKGAVVDPGGEVPRLINEVQQLGIDIEKILLTHCHIDHAGGTADIAAHFNVPIVGPEKQEQFWIDALPMQSQRFGFAEAKGFEVDQWLQDNDQVTIGNQVLKVVHTPGHTPGHVVFYHQPTETAWVGDVIFQGSIGRTDFPKSVHQDLIDSITQKLWRLGDQVQFIPGHGPMSTFGQERKTNPFVADKNFG